MGEQSEIQSFYKNQTIFLTGGTGFVGKVLVAKLLKDCLGVKMIYMMVRPKKNKTSQERFEEFFNWRCFDAAKSSIPDLPSKIQMIEGDCEKPFLGLSHQVREMLIKETTIVIHAAADVRFDQELTSMVHKNVIAVKDLLDLAKEMSHLKAFVYVSTAYSNAPRIFIDEKFYEPNIAPDDLLSLTKILDKDTLNVITPNLLKDWPNVYTFTKSVAEDLIKREAKSLPVAIVRPGIIMCSHVEPLPAWIDNFHGLSAVCMGMFLGVIRSVYYKKNVVLNAVPCDYTVNQILAAVWDLGRNGGDKSQPDDIPIYNDVGTGYRAVLFEDTFQKFKWKLPSPKSLWYPNCTFTESYLLHSIQISFLILMAHVVDVVLFCLGKERIAVEKCQKVHKGLEVLYYFTTTNFHFTHGNVDKLWSKMSDCDKKIFNFDMTNFDWDDFLETSFKYSRLYLLNESPDDIPLAKKRHRFLFFLHYGFIILTWFLMIYFFLKLFNWW